MARVRRRGRHDADHWPGFVDALATLLLVVVFLLSLFIAAQFTLGRALSSRDAQLDSARSRLAELADMLALEKARTSDARDQIARLMVTLQESKDDLATRDATIAGLQTQLDQSAAAVAAGQDALKKEKQLSKSARDEVAALNAQLAALNAQIARLNAALEAAETKDKKQKVQIVNLGKRLNAALARQVSELAKYKSDFFAKMLEVLGDKPGVKVVGDRFVFESDVLFASGSAKLNPAGEQQLAIIANAIMDVNREIPKKIDWVIRVDGYTDKVPVRPGGQYADNWELSTARALSVVHFLTQAGVPPQHLVAAGFGQYHPIDRGSSAQALARNRRIELKMDAR